MCFLYLAGINRFKFEREVDTRYIQVSPPCFPHAPCLAESKSARSSSHFYSQLYTSRNTHRTRMTDDKGYRPAHN